jgi:hypothetical protein
LTVVPRRSMLFALRIRDKPPALLRPRAHGLDA